MKKIIIAFYAASFLFACNDEKTAAKTEETNLISTASNISAEPDEWVPVDSATAMKTMMEAGTPGQQHAMLAKGDGKWTAETTMWMSPDAAPMTAKSNAVNKMIFGGRYQQTSFKGDFMGMPFEGSSMTGYDNAKKVYFTTWMDNMSTGLMNMEGSWDEASKSIHFKGKMICPANGKECEMREIYKIVDDNTHVMEMYGPDMKTGKEYKSMEIKFARSK
ncbi:MAG: DUF1579 domain-containing protein [Chitinophagaceae bacterium]